MRTATFAGILSGTIDFLKANWLIMIGMFVAMCVVLGVLGYLFLGSFFAQTMMSATPDPTMIMGMMGRFFLFYLIALTGMYGVTLAIYRHGMTNGQDPITQNLGWALLGGLTLTLLYIGLVIALYIVLAIIMVILFALVGGGVSMMGPGGFSPEAVSGPAIILVIVFYIAFLVGMLWLAARLCLISPVMAAQRTVNPLTGLAQSWTLTKPSQWTIVGFFLAVVIGLIVVMLVFGMVVSAINVPGLVLLAYIPIALFGWSIPPGIYGQVAVPDHSATFA